jgi:3-oxoadipate enol-lactonase
MRLATANGVSLHYDDSGERNGTPIVFANALGTDFRIWDKVLSAFDAKYRIVRYDMRGHGLSDATDAPYRIESDHAADLIALLDHLDVENAVLCGVSVGGLIAQAVYAARPDLVRAMVISSTAHKIGDAETWNGRIEQAARNGMVSMAQPTMERWFTPGFRAQHAAELAGYRNMVARTTLSGFTGTLAAIRDADFTEEAKQIGVPLLCLAGGEDGGIKPEVVKSLADLVPGSRYELIEGVGHHPQIEKPEEWVALVDKFLGEW